MAQQVPVKPVYANHARTRMAERGVSEAEVEAAIFAPERWYHGEDGEVVAVRRIGRRTIRVPYLSLPAAPKVLTVIAE